MDELVHILNLWISILILKLNGRDISAVQTFCSFSLSQVEMVLSQEEGHKSTWSTCGARCRSGALFMLDIATTV